MERQSPTPETRRRMQRQSGRDTKPEKALRAELHKRGLRYRLHVQIVEGTRRTADIVFRRGSIAIFVDGCFWHGCPDHGTVPSNNRDWWREKIAANVARDRDTDTRLAARGWHVLRIWEHSDMAEVAAQIERLLRLRAG